jgi:hypothetical protein
MRILLRSLVATAFVLAVAIGGASSTLAATPGSSENANGAQTGSDTLSGSSCFDDIGTVYCTDIRSRIHLVTTPGATDQSTLDIVENVTVSDESGNLIASFKSVSHSKGTFGPDFESRVFEVSHTNVKGDNHCTFTEFLKMIDYQIVLEKVTGSCD